VGNGSSAAIVSPDGVGVGSDNVSPRKPDLSHDRRKVLVRDHLLGKYKLLFAAN